MLHWVHLLRKKILHISLLSLLLSSLSIQVVQAQASDANKPYDYDFFAANGILYLDHAAVCAGGLTGSTVKEWIWSYLTGKGLSAEQAAGIMGNMQAESGFIPTRHQSSSGALFDSTYSKAWGLVQWDGGRRFTAPDKGVVGSLRKEKPELAKYLDITYDTVRNPATTIPEADLKALTLFELEYMYGESILRPVTASGFGKAANEWETLKLQQTVENATVFWHNNFEVSADSPERVLASRGGFANTIYNELGKTGGAKSGTSSSGCADTSTFGSAVRSYAWPKYKGITTVAKPEYVTAYTKAKGEQRYIGGGIYPGIDCGGFVTTLMIDSGFEPRYNYDGKVNGSPPAGPTGTQEAWLKANWTYLGIGSGINSADLKPGDVAMLDGHTYVYVRGEGGIPQDESNLPEEQRFETNIASASYGEVPGGPWRAPMAGKEQVTSSDTRWYRKR